MKGIERQIPDKFPNRIIVVENQRKLHLYKPNWAETLSKDRLKEEENINEESRQCDGSLAEGSTGSPWSVKVSTKGRAVKAPSTRMIDVGSEGTGEFYDLPSGIFDRPTRGCTNDDSSLHVLPAWNSTSMVRRSAMLPYVCTAKVTTTNALLFSSFRKIAWYARTWQPRYPVLVIYSFHIHNRSPINQRCLLFLRCVHPIANIFGESLFSWPFIFTI